MIRQIESTHVARSLRDRNPRLGETHYRRPLAPRAGSRRGATRLRCPRLGETRLRGRRPAFTVAESLVALAVLGAAAALLGQLLGELAQQRRAADQQSRALQQAANVMEQLSVIPYTDLTPDRAGKLGLSAPARQHLPGAQLEITIVPAPDEPPAKQVQVTLRWLDRSGRYGVPVQLTAWRHQERSGP